MDSNYPLPATGNQTPSWPPPFAISLIVVVMVGIVSAAFWLLSRRHNRHSKTPSPIPPTSSRPPSARVTPNPPPPPSSSPTSPPHSRYGHHFPECEGDSCHNCTMPGYCRDRQAACGACVCYDNKVCLSSDALGCSISEPGGVSIHTQDMLDGDQLQIGCVWDDQPPVWLPVCNREKKCTQAGDWTCDQSHAFKDLENKNWYLCSTITG